MLIHIYTREEFQVLVYSDRIVLRIRTQTNGFLALEDEISVMNVLGCSLSSGERNDDKILLRLFVQERLFWFVADVSLTVQCAAICLVCSIENR